MPQRIRTKLTFANVTSVLALFIALGGGAYAASQLPANSVGTKQLKNGAVTGAKVKTGSLLASNFAAGQVPAGPRGPQGEPGPSTGTAGGDLSGSYPNPSIAAGAVKTSNFASGATAPNATQLGGEEASAFLPSTDVQRISFHPNICVTSASAGCTANILHMEGETLKATCGNGTPGANEIKIQAEGLTVESTNAAFIGSAAGGTPHAGGFGGFGTVVDVTAQEEAQIGTIVVAGNTYTITVSLQVYSVTFGDHSACQVNGTAVLAS